MLANALFVSVWIGDDYVMTEKPFLKIIDDYYIKYGNEGQLFDLHKPADIRSLIRIINRDNGFSELQCEYNDSEDTGLKRLYEQ